MLQNEIYHLKGSLANNPGPFENPVPKPLPEMPQNPPGPAPLVEKPKQPMHSHANPEPAGALDTMLKNRNEISPNTPFLKPILYFCFPPQKEHRAL